MLYFRGPESAVHGLGSGQLKWLSLCNVTASCWECLQPAGRLPGAARSAEIWIASSGHRQDTEALLHSSEFSMVRESGDARDRLTHLDSCLSLQDLLMSQVLLLQGPE